jgi:putative membrane protein
MILPPWLRLALHWLLNAVALLVVAEWVDGITVTGYGAALLTALVLGIINWSIKPLLLLLTLPATVFTLGFFALVINALLFWAATGIVPGVVVADFWAAFWGALLYSILTGIIAIALSDPHSDWTVRWRIERRRWKRGDKDPWL